MPTEKSQMKPRSFRAPNMMAALESIQRELGPDALVISAREIPNGPAWQVWRQSGVEVIATPGPSLQISTKPQSPPKQNGGQGARVKTPKPRVSPREIPNSHSPVTNKEKPFTKTTPAYISAALTAARDKLLAHGVDKALVSKVVATCAETLNPSALKDKTRIQKHLQSQLEARLHTLKGSQFTANRVVCLVGTSGAGKTSTTAKLAIYYTKTMGQKVAWVCADTIRAGAIAETRAYADSLGLPLQLAYTPGELAEVVTAESAADLILVDTPSCNPRREADVVELGALLTALPTRATYLVAPVTAKDVDLGQTLAALGPFDLKGLVATKLDETETVGSLINAAWRTRLPLAYFTTGPRVLDDLQPASAMKLVKMLFER